MYSSETARPFKAKFYVEPPWDGGSKVYINCSGHMTKMTAMLTYGKKKTFKIFYRTVNPTIGKDDHHAHIW